MAVRVSAASQNIFFLVLWFLDGTMATLVAEHQMEIKCVVGDMDVCLLAGYLNL